jgi:hypothetical protein
MLTALALSGHLAYVALCSSPTALALGGGGGEADEKCFHGGLNLLSAGRGGGGGEWSKSRPGFVSVVLSSSTVKQCSSC